MWRNRWLVLLGPPLILAAIAVPGLSGRLAVRAGAMPLAAPRPVAACPHPVPSAPGEGPAATSAAVAAWWRMEPRIDAAGALSGWTLGVGAAGVRDARLPLPPASTVTGPRAGLIITASEGAGTSDRSIIRIVDAAAGCAREIAIAGRIVRRAVADPDGAGVIAQLLEPVTRRDLGTWRIGPDGRLGSRLLEPLPDGLRDAARIDRVWATDLRLDVGGRRLAVQSCHPDACLTRVLDLATRTVTTLAGDGQGPLVGFAGDRLVAWGSCSGLPCPVIVVDLGDGSSRPIAPDTNGAAVTADGRRLVILRAGPGGGDRELLAIDVESGTIRSLGRAGDGVPLSGAAGDLAGLEVTGPSVAIGHAGLAAAPLVVDLDAPSPRSPDREVQP